MGGRNLLDACTAALLVVVSLLTLTGCMGADKTVLFRYDAARDEFSYLVVYQRIFDGHNYSDHSGLPVYDVGPDKIADLQAIEVHKNDLIVEPLPFDPPFDMGFVRLSEHRYWNTNVFCGPAVYVDTPLNLRDIRVIPGGFFRRGKDNLCFYQGAILPGHTLDAALDELNTSFADYTTTQPSAFDSAFEQLKDRHPIPWDECTKLCLQAISQIGDGSQPTTQPLGVDLPFSTDSVRLFLNQMQHHELKLRRNGVMLSLRIAITSEDARQVIKCIDLFRPALAARATQLERSDSSEAMPVRLESDLLSELSFSAPEPNVLLITLDLADAIPKLSHKPADPLPPLPDTALNKIAALSQAVEGKLAIDPNLTVDQLQADFQSGKLTAAGR